MSEWRARAGNYSHLTISVNLSPKQFLQPNLVEDIRNLMHELRTPPEILKLEITESNHDGRSHSIC